MRELLHRYKALLFTSELIRFNTLMLIGTAVISALNYVYYPILGRLLPAAQLGEVQVIISIITQLMFVLGIGRMVILNVLTNEKSAHNKQIFMAEAEKALARTALILSLVVVLTMPFLKHFLQISSYAPLLVLMPIIIVSGVRSSRDAYMRAHSLFKQAITADIIVAVIRIIFAVLLVLLGFGSQGALAGLAIGLFVSAFYIHKVTTAHGLRLPLLSYYLPSNLKKPIRTKLMRPHVRYAAVVALVGVLQALIVVMDSVSAKHYFAPEQAGLYAGISIVGNIVLFISGSVNGVLAASVRMDIDHLFNIRKLLVSSGLVVFVGSFVASLFTIAPSFFITVLLGSRYAVYSHLLPKVALTMLLLSVVNLLFSYHIALRDTSVVYAAAISMIVMVGSVIIRHDSLEQMISALLFASCIVFAINVGRSTWWNSQMIARQTQ